MTRLWALAVLLLSLSTQTAAEPTQDALSLRISPKTAIGNATLTIYPRISRHADNRAYSITVMCGDLEIARSIRQLDGKAAEPTQPPMRVAKLPSCEYVIRALLVRVVEGEERIVDRRTVVFLVW